MFSVREASKRKRASCNWLEGKRHAKLALW